MISFDEAFQKVINSAFEIGAENISLQSVLHRVLSEDVKADRDMPPFRKSAVDGYACKKPQTGQSLKLLEKVPAGESPTMEIKPGTCTKVMTGAEVPPGTEWVVMVEHTSDGNEGLVKIDKPGTKSNIAEQGEDFVRGDLVLSSGTFLRPQHIAILATVGKSQVRVSKQPAVNIIPTGDELVEPGVEPGKSQIRNSNASQLIAQLTEMGINANYSGIVKDTRRDLDDLLKSSLDDYHLTLLTGGVSMGDYDYVPEMMKQNGVEIIFHKIAMKPGKPTILGKKGNHLVIGLPGNPVSTFLQFELLVKPLLYALMGAVYNPIEWKLPVGEDIPSKPSSRDSWKPVEIKEGKIYPIGYHGSGHLHALNKAQGFICIPAGNKGFQKGEMVDVRQI